MIGFLVICAVFYEVSGSAVPDFRKRFLDAHNAVRSELALGIWINGNETIGPAANMVKLKWDKDLEISVRKYTHGHCVGHSEAKVNGQSVGENWFKTSSTGKIEQFGNGTVETSVKNWVEEVWASGNNGHSTQVMWAKTSKVGCYSQDCSNNGWSDFFVVCQYLETGNMGGEEVYIEGEACSKCPQGSTCEKETGLCVFPGQEVTVPDQKIIDEIDNGSDQVLPSSVLIFVVYLLV